MHMFQRQLKLAQKQIPELEEKILNEVRVKSISSQNGVSVQRRTYIKIENRRVSYSSRLPSNAPSVPSMHHHH